MKKIGKRFKNGAASFYIVAFATLVLVILSVSFASVIMSEITRTSNDDLSQSAYDSALAGIEDAKLAYANYQRCTEANSTVPDSLTSGEDVSCEDIMYWVERKPDCDMVAHILGRIGKYENGEESGGVLIRETSSGNNNLNQAYTCVKINRILSDYRASLGSSNPTKVIKADLSTSAGSISSVRISWYSNPGGEMYNYNNFVNNRVAFQKIATFRAATPPTIAVQLVQTAGEFKMEDLLSPTNSNGQTDRATVYLVPTKVAEGENPTYTYSKNAYNGTKNLISASQMAATNNMEKNLPYTVYCPQADKATTEFACTVEIELPSPIGSGDRSDDTFMFAVNLPYGQPDTDFSMEFLCGDSVEGCESRKVESEERLTANVTDVQVMIDSTGRANDLYRRVETRFEASDASFPYQFYAVEGLNSSDSGGYAIKKELTVTKEYGI